MHIEATFDKWKVFLLYVGTYLAAALVFVAVFTGCESLLDAGFLIPVVLFLAVTLIFPAGMAWPCDPLVALWFPHSHGWLYCAPIGYFMFLLLFVLMLRFRKVKQTLVLWIVMIALLALSFKGVLDILHGIGKAIS